MGKLIGRSSGGLPPPTYGSGGAMLHLSLGGAKFIRVEGGRPGGGAPNEELDLE